VRDVPTTSVDTTIEELARLMIEQDTRRVPVVDGVLEGIITITDVIRAIADGDVAVDATVGEVAGADVNTTYVGTPLSVAERGLYYANVPYTVVLGDDGEMTGMLTEVDVIAVAEVVDGEDETGDSIAGEDDEWMWEGIKAVGNRYLPTRDVEIPEEPVEEFMTADVVSVSGRRTVQEAAQLQIRHDVEQLPVVSGDELAGVVRDVHLLEAIRE